MIEVTKKDIGRCVVYYEGHGEIEKGIITSFNESYVFIRYAYQDSDSGGIATYRDHLSYFNPEENKKGKRIMEDLRKYCKQCDSWKAHKDFGKRAASKDGMKGMCRVCVAKYNKKYKIENAGTYYGVTR